MCRLPFASKQGVGLSAPDRYPPVEHDQDTSWSAVKAPNPPPSRTLSAKVAQQPLESCLQRRSAPEEEMKELESLFLLPAVPSRCRVRGRIARADAQSSKPA